MTRRNDQLLAPAPAVVFATEQAEAHIVAEMKTKHEAAAHHAASRGGHAIQIGEEIAQLENEINERQAWVIQKDGEKRQAEAEARAAQDVAKGYADMLAAAGVLVRPFGDELSHTPDRNIERIGAAHDGPDGAIGMKP